LVVRWVFAFEVRTRRGLAVEYAKANQVVDVPPNLVRRGGRGGRKRQDKAGRLVLLDRDDRRKQRRHRREMVVDENYAPIANCVGLAAIPENPLSTFEFEMFARHPHGDRTRVEPTRPYPFVVQQSDAARGDEPEDDVVPLRRTNALDDEDVEGGVERAGDLVRDRDSAGWLGQNEQVGPIGVS